MIASLVGRYRMINGGGCMSELFMGHCFFNGLIRTNLENAT